MTHISSWRTICRWGLERIRDKDFKNGNGLLEPLVLVGLEEASGSSKGKSILVNEAKANRKNRLLNKKGVCWLFWEKQKSWANKGLVIRKWNRILDKGTKEFTSATTRLPMKKDK